MTAAYSAASIGEPAAAPMSSALRLSFAYLLVSSGSFGTLREQLSTLCECVRIDPFLALIQVDFCPHSVPSVLLLPDRDRLETQKAKT